MGFGGGSSQQPSTSIVQPPNPPGGPLQDALVSHGAAMLESNIPYAHFGSGAALLPRSPLGQVYVPGPNPTIFGNPYNQSAHAGYFGSASGSNAPQPGQQQPQQQAMGGGQQGGQGGGQAMGGGQQQQQSPFQNPNSPGAQMLAPLAALLHPGVLSQLFGMFGQQPPGGGQSQPTQQSQSQPQQQQSQSQPQQQSGAQQ